MNLATIQLKGGVRLNYLMRRSAAAEFRTVTGLSAHNL